MRAWQNVAVFNFLRKFRAKEKKSENRPFSACFPPSPFSHRQFYWQSMVSPLQSRKKGWHAFKKKRNMLMSKK